MLVSKEKGGHYCRCGSEPDRPYITAITFPSAGAVVCQTKQWTVRREIGPLATLKNTEVQGIVSPDLFDTVLTNYLARSNQTLSRLHFRAEARRFPCGRIPAERRNAKSHSFTGLFLRGKGSLISCFTNRGKVRGWPTKSNSIKASD
jgi:hypothetical protein